MAIYSITYDLIKDKDYAKIIKAIKAISGTWAKPTQSQWLVDTYKTEAEIRDNLKNYMDNDDELFVCKLDMPHWAAKNISKEVLGWLHDRKDS
ncbi:hypothetical protein D3C80_1554360 [compost metagenome]